MGFGKSGDEQDVMKFMQAMALLVPFMIAMIAVALAEKRED